MLENYLNQVRSTTPLVHNITNYVTVNDCANILIACGGAPIMADDIDDAVEITAICGGLNLNIGTLNSRTIPAMMAAGIRAGELNHPILLDPVGAGASAQRTQTALNLMENLPLTAIRGNISEIKTLATGTGATRGVDADVADTVTPETLDAVIAFAQEFAAKTGAVIAITGATDIVATGDRAGIIRNGVPMMADITGSGCMLSAMATAYLTANPGDSFMAMVAAICAMGVAGEIAVKNMLPSDGNATFRNRLIDAIYHLDGDTLEGRASYELR
ncbi:hydroxyethylthiazole kinase [Eubacterium barkeri]|uniref:Hydroxyethylthiazole kinase n=1 Tax=Eubacterium barkeri TaxID=1528 RepID=A0A1H3FMI5_EUBBA|nr:hydroxyethylthiazole kinase [Eubacterium barkeri]SDX92252.1 hydroxyethylthiazole kinase [Eubacterium barkeri]